jgi:hypothetical protein
MNKSLLIFVFFAISSTSYSQYLQDVDFSTLAKMNQEKVSASEEFGFSSADEIPSSYSLEDFCVVSNQGESSSCTGFAVANGAMTILYNLVNDITSINEKWVNRFDPFYLYASLKDQDDLDCIASGGCDCGSQIGEALDLIENYGCKKHYLYPNLECSSTLNKNNLRSIVNVTGAYSIDDYFNFFEYEEIDGEWYKSVEIDVLKVALNSNNPITAGINVDEEFGELNPSNFTYSAPKGDLGRHAVTVVGYDDYENGGSFRVLNSYGSAWGDDGFFWITYEDFEDQADVAYVIVKEDWDGWRDDIYSDNFYKGHFGDSEIKTWEGPMDDDRNFHGRGIIDDETYSAIGVYNHGISHGWWLLFSDLDAEDSWSGWVLFEDGEFIETEEFGFTSSSLENLEKVKSALHMDNMELELSDEPASIDNFTNEVLKSITSKAFAN